MTSISVLESVDPDTLVQNVFPQGEYSGSEIVITGFIHAANDVDLQCANIRSLAAGGEVGLILYYVGVYMQAIDKRLIDLADELDFVLICMPVGHADLRYSEVICDVMHCIYQDQSLNESLVSEILARVSRLPKHQQTVNTVLKMVSDRITASCILCDESGNILNLIAWPRTLEGLIKENEKKIKNYSLKRESVKANGKSCPFLPSAKSYISEIVIDGQNSYFFIVLKEGEDLAERAFLQVTDLVQLGINIWGQQHADLAIHELVRAIMQDDPMKMRRLGEIFHVDVASIHEMWMICSEKSDFVELIKNRLEEIKHTVQTCAKNVIVDIYEKQVIVFSSTPYSLREAKEQMEILCSFLNMELKASRKTGVDKITIIKCSGLHNTAEVRETYLWNEDYLEDARKIFPNRNILSSGELKFAGECHKRINCGEETVQNTLHCLEFVQNDKEGEHLIDTLAVFLLDGEMNIALTAQLMFLHKNTIKYRIKRISDICGFQPDKMPEGFSLYQAVAIKRLLS